MPAVLSEEAARTLLNGVIIPAHPLIITANRGLDERRQSALTRYYLDAGAGGLAVGVHTTQFGIRDAGLLPAVLELAAVTAREVRPSRRPLMIAGVAGPTTAAVAEAATAAALGYDIALVIMRGLDDLDEAQLIAHCRAIGEVLPLCGFYLQPAVGGRNLSLNFWRALAELPALRAVKIAPFDRYRTIDVVRGICESGRAAEVALYTGNDDNIVGDLLTGFEVSVAGTKFRKNIVGGLLGQTAVWTRAAVDILERVHQSLALGRIDPELLTLGAQLTDANAAVFDVANNFAGSIAGIHEILRRQHLLDQVHLLDPEETLSPGQAEELDRVIAAYPHLTDDSFVAEHRADWLSSRIPQGAQ